MDNQLNPDIFGKNLLQQTLNTWINPELDKRKKDNILPPNFTLQKAQVLFCVDGTQIVRVNSEIKAVVKAKINKAVQKGEALYENDIDELTGIELLDEEKDFGHITIVRFKNLWMIAFSFIYNITISKQFYDIGIAFLSSAEDSFNKNNLRPMVDSLTTANENLLKSRISLYPDNKIRKSKTHGGVQTIASYHSRVTGIIKSNQKDVLNKLIGMRDKARYMPEFKIDYEEARLLLSTTKILATDINNILTKARPLSVKS